MSQTLLSGIGVSEGIRIGKARLFVHGEVPQTTQDIPAPSVEAEIQRFSQAVQNAVENVDALIADSEKTLGKDKIGVLKGQKSILKDPAYCPEIEKLIRGKLFSPEKAVRQVTDQLTAVFENMKNAYMKERAADIRDAGNRLLDTLLGRQSGLSGIDSPVILAADDLAPSDTIQLNKEFVLAFATLRGGKSAHTSIFARSLGIPAVVGVARLLDTVHDGDTVIVDGEQGLCIVEPDEPTLLRYREKMEAEAKEHQLLNEYAARAARTADGRSILVAANIGSAADGEYAVSQGAEGVGLLRTEQLYFSRATAPTEEELFREYRKIAQIHAPREVIIRTLDAGGDKPVPYLAMGNEQNPFLGFRAIRYCLADKPLFLTQLRAILRASAFGKLAVMFPMISGYDELLQAKAVLREAMAQLSAEGAAFDTQIRTGIMVEVPSAAIQADILAKEVDFFSIGTNDLTQYCLAADRGNEKVAYLYDSFHPAVLRLIASVSTAAHEHGITVGMCGGMAGEPMAVPLLVGLKLDELSVSAGGIPRIKYTLSRLDGNECEQLASKALSCRSVSEVRNLLAGFYESRIG